MLIIFCYLMSIFLVIVILPVLTWFRLGICNVSIDYIILCPILRGDSWSWLNFAPRWQLQLSVDCIFHTCAKMIEIQKIYLQKIHGLHELGSRMECNDTLHGSELGLHWVLGPKNSKFGPMGPKFLAQKFLYTKLFRYHGAILVGF